MQNSLDNSSKIVTQTFTNPSLVEKLRSGFDQIAKLVSTRLVCWSFRIDRRGLIVFEVFQFERISSVQKGGYLGSCLN